MGRAVAPADVAHRRRARVPIHVRLHLGHGEWKIVLGPFARSAPTSEGARALPHGDLGRSRSSRPSPVTAPISRSPSSPDGTVTIAFTDIEESMKLTRCSAIGDGWTSCTRTTRSSTALTDEHGGTIVKGQGDGFMLAFASARRAIACAQGVQRGFAETFNDPGSPIRVRIGLHVGRAIDEADDFFGHAVNYAARIASKASGGEVVVSALVHALVAQTGEFRFEESARGRAQRRRRSAAALPARPRAR